MSNTCFVVMPIGDQYIGDKHITADSLRQKYTHIIKNAIAQAKPGLTVIRADEELNPGSISNDIFTKLMHSTYVIADITYPNPNVFYELGIRHAISSRTILIRERSSERVPFDISHLRYIEYTHDPGGMEALAEELKKRFSFYDHNPQKVDNQFLELCEFTNFVPDVFKNKTDNEKASKIKLLQLLFSKPDLITKIMSDDSDEDKQQAFIQVLAEDPSLFQSMASLMLDF